MSRLAQIVKKPVTIAAITVVVVAFVVGKKMQYYAAGPSGEKDCPPLSPSTTDPSKEYKVHIEAYPGSLSWVQKGGTINDASCLSKTSIYGIVQVKEVEDIKNALFFAKENDLKISIAGVRHSMGGQAFYKNALVLDMTQFNRMSLDENKKTLTVQSGATWHDIQNNLHPKFAVKAMQSTDIFTVGGSISVNAHGMDHHVGALGKTIRSMRVILSDGTLERVSKTENKELFNLIIGGYGLFGIIVDAELEVAENAVYRSERKIINYKEFPQIFENEIESDETIGLFYGHLSTAPQSFLKEMILYSYRDISVEGVEIPPLEEVSSVTLRRLVFNLAKKGSIPMRLKWFAEKYIEPMLENCPVSRNQAMGEGEACLVSRNEPMHDSVPYLRNSLKDDTDILHEYFIPRDQFTSYIDGVRGIMQENDVNLLNASIRVVHKEDNFLNYAPEEMFSLVLYINQRTDAKSNERIGVVTRALIDLTAQHGGRFFLPYQLHYTDEELEESYPEIRSFFAEKGRYDPDRRLTNTFYEKYSTEKK